MSRLRVSVQEARHLFHNLQRDVRALYDEELATTHEEPDSEAEAGWALVDAEFRSVYEMARFGLDVVDLEEADDIEVFRGNCEDIAGIEPLNTDLIREIAKETESIGELLESNALYRKTIPARVEEHFSTYVDQKRRHYDRIVEQAVPVVSPDASVAPDLPPNTLCDALAYLSERLADSSARLRALT